MAMSEADLKWVEGVITRIGGLYNKKGSNINSVMSYDEILRVLAYTAAALMQDAPLIEDMHKLFDIIGRVPEVKMLFLGDYVDRGDQSLETVLYLFALKLRYKDRVFLLRGNHETPAVNRIYGFYAECSVRYCPGLWWEFISVFNRLPMAGLIARRILCMHGGLSPELTSLDLIRQVKRPCEPVVVQDGYELMVGRKLITIFSAPNYAGQFNNAAAVVCIDGELQVSRNYSISKGDLHLFVSNETALK
ncbi:unnamed protein product [Anisakis simplex]|uniref:Serine/threonine-protein phosphatase n=1 Tax=Anisakis simplex TaxID=6269 RepID=A0A0M3KC22_ANISI|nr:unnamed protein product [Anisakis simplex]